MSCSFMKLPFRRFDTHRIKLVRSFLIIIFVNNKFCYEFNKEELVWLELSVLERQELLEILGSTPRVMTGY